MSKKLLVEHVVITPGNVTQAGGKYLVESSGRSLIVTLPVTTVDVKNLNERVYSTPVMEGAISRAKNSFEARELLCSVNEHPAETAYVTPGAASHVVTDAWLEGGLMYNKWEILDTASGRDLRALIEANVAFGVSIRGLGSEDDAGNILDDYEFLGCDCVADPSAQLRVRANVVAESNKIFSNPKTPVRTEGSKTMKTRESLNRFLSEQKVLLASDLAKSRVAAHQRLAQVESALADVDLPARDLAAVYQTWEAIRADVTAQLESAPATSESNANDNHAKEIATLRKLLDARTRQLRTSLESVRLMSGQLTESTAQLRAARSLTEGRKDAADRAQARKVDHHVARLTRENARLRRAVHHLRLKGEGLQAGLNTAISVAATAQHAARVAVQEAVKATKSSKAVKPKAGAPKQESRRPIGVKSSPRVQEKTLPKRKEVKSGEHGIPGWI